LLLIFAETRQLGRSCEPTKRSPDRSRRVPGAVGAVCRGGLPVVMP